MKLEPASLPNLTALYAVCRQATQPMIGLDDDSLNETSLNIQNLTVDSQLLASPDSCHTEDVVEKGNY